MTDEVDISDLPVPEADISDLPIPKPHETPYAPKGYVGPPEAGYGGEFMQHPSTKRQKYSSAELAAAKSGVDVDTGLPPSIAYNPAMGFTGDDPKDWAPVIRDKLKAHFGAKFNPANDMRPSSVPGKFEYKNPDTGRWTTFSNSASDLPGSVPIAAAAQVPPIVGNAAGTLIGGGLGSFSGPTGTYMGARTGGAIGMSAGQSATAYIRTSIGNLLGVNKADPTDTATAELGSALKWNALFEVGGMGKDFAKYRLFGKSPITPKVATTILEGVDRNREVVDTVQAVSPDFKPFLPQIANDPQGLSLLGQLQGHETFGLKILAQKDKTEKGLAGYLDAAALAAGADPAANVTAQGALGGATSVATDAENMRRSDITEALDRLSTSYKAIRDKYPATSSQVIDATNAFRTALDKVRIKAKNGKDMAYNIVYGEPGERPGAPRSGGLLPPMADDHLAYDEGFTSWMNGVQAKADRSEYKGDKDFYLQLLPKGDRYFSTIGGMDQAIGYLREWKRDLQKPGSTSMRGSVIDVQNAIDAWTGLRSRTIGGEAATPQQKALYTAMTNAEDKATEYGSAWQRAFVARLVGADSKGNFKLLDQSVIGAIIAKKDKSSYDQLVTAVKSDPTALQELRNIYMGIYASKFTTNGVPDAAKHQKFMELYGDYMKDLFTPEEMADINTHGNIAKTVAEYQQSLANMSSKFKELFGKDVDQFTPEQLLANVDREEPLTFQKTVRGIKELDSHMGSDIMGSLKTAYITRLRNQAQTAKYIDLGQLEKMISDPMVNNIKELYGPKYVEALKTTIAGLKMARAEASTTVSAPATNNLYTYLLRATIAPPLSREGRIISGIGKFKQDRYMSILFDALSDPDKMVQLAKVGSKDILKSAVGRSIWAIAQPKAGARYAQGTDPWTSDATPDAPPRQLF